MYFSAPASLVQSPIPAALATFSSISASRSHGPSLKEDPLLLAVTILFPVFGVIALLNVLIPVVLCCCGICTVGHAAKGERKTVGIKRGKAHNGQVKDIEQQLPGESTTEPTYEKVEIPSAYPQGGQEPHSS